METLMQNNRK